MNMKRNIQIVFASALTLLCLGSCTADKTAPPWQGRLLLL